MFGYNRKKYFSPKKNPIPVDVSKDQSVGL